MRVLLTTDTIGGVWTYTKELTEGLLERYHSVALVSLGRLPSATQSLWAASLEARYPGCFHYSPLDTPLEWMDENDRAYSGTEAELVALAKSFRPDLLHTNQFCFGKLPVSIPKLVVAHSDVLSWAAACRPDGLEASPWLQQYKSLVQAGLGAADAVVAPSHWMLQALADRFTLPGEAFVVPNGREITVPPNAPERKLQAVSVGRLWDEAKGLALLASIKPPFPILIAGELQHGTQNAPESIGDASLLGALDEERLIAILRSSSIYLALSIYEPFGLAPLEAALCGCAIIANDIPSFREVWGSAALYFQDAHTLNALLLRLANEPNLIAEFQSRALSCALQMSRTRMTELYLNLYHHLVDPDHPFPNSPVLPEVLSHAS